MTVNSRISHLVLPLFVLFGGSVATAEGAMNGGGGGPPPAARPISMSEVEDFTYECNATLTEFYTPKGKAPQQSQAIAHFSIEKADYLKDPQFNPADAENFWKTVRGKFHRQYEWTDFELSISRVTSTNSVVDGLTLGLQIDGFEMENVYSGDSGFSPGETLTGTATADNSQPLQPVGTVWDLSGSNPFHTVQPDTKVRLTATCTRTK